MQQSSISEPTMVRLATPAEYAAVGDLTVRGYAHDGFLKPGDRYAARLRDAADRAAQAELWIAEIDGAPAGTVTFCPPGSAYREISRDDEGEFRMLSVDPTARGRGVGRALVLQCARRTADFGLTGIAMCSLPSMTTAHRLYAREGFVRAPERDIEPVEGVTLWAFARAL